jgi:hypothetical protein
MNRLNGILISIAFIVSLVACAGAFEGQDDMGINQWVAVENQFENDFGGQQDGGNPQYPDETRMGAKRHIKDTDEQDNGLEDRPGEDAAKHLFDKGFGEPWTGGNPPHSDTFDPKYSQYYSIYKGSSARKHIEIPKKHEIRDKIPDTVYFSYQMDAIPFTQYKTYPTYTGGNSLWIQGDTSWTQYAQVPQGSSLSLLATSLSGGSGYLYEISPNGMQLSNWFYFFPGSSQMSFNADTVGQHILNFIINGQVSNSVVIDVIPYTPSYQNPYPQGTILPPDPIPMSITGDSIATIVSQGMRGYQVFLDGNYIGTEGTGGDPLDGKFSFRVIGNQNHEIRVFDGQFNYPKTMFFERGGTKIIYVEPGTAVYI